MNLLFTSYYGLGKGGAEVSMSLLARELQKKHKIFIASTEEFKGIKTYVFGKGTRYIPNLDWQNSLMANFFADVIEKENIKIIHSHDSKTAVAAIMAAKKKNIRVVTHYRDYWFCCPKSSLLKHDGTNCEKCDFESLKECSKKSRVFWDKYKLEYLNKIQGLLNTADEKIAISNAVSEKLGIIGIYDAKIIPNPVDTSMFKEKRSENFRHSDLNIGYVGSLSYNKGLQSITKALTNILNEYKNARLTVTGDGELKENLVNEFKEFNERVVFNGNLGYDETIEMYDSLDIVLIPSLWQEPFSRVAIEAMAAGKPIIASNVGGLKNIIKKEFGFLIDLNENEKWEEAMKALIENPIKRNVMGINAVRESKKYDVGIIAELIEKLYDRT